MPRPRLELRLDQRQKMVPKMMVASELMVMNVAQLEEKLTQMAEENPLLEPPEGIICYGCGAVLSGYPEFCPTCGRLIYVRERKEFPWEELSLFEKRRSWKEFLREEVETFVELTQEEREIFHVILASLDGSGFLGMEVSRLAFSLGKSEDAVWRVMAKIREAGFLGFASYDALEFLLLQAQRLGLLEEKDLRVLRREALENPDALKQRLTPHLRELFLSPAQFFEATLGREREDLQGWEEVVVPDAEIVAVAEEEFTVALNTPPSLRLIVTEEALALSKKKNAMSPRELAFWQEKLREAKEIVSCLSYRHRLLLQVLEYIVEREKGFLAHGFPHFVPLRQRDIAGALGVSVSAVCQILKNKHLRFPDGVVRPVKFFFDASYPVKEAMRMVLRDEDPRHPLSDEEIVARLRERGFSIARRTCALYREEMGILSSHLRKKVPLK
ncbi:MAG: hypothetical protein ACP5Q4_05635 [Candidatus Caldatribacteriaceae bacterium]